jgi:hypothetical protein
MEQRVSLITLGVLDLNRSREFYERPGAVPWHTQKASHSSRQEAWL